MKHYSVRGFLVQIVHNYLAQSAKYNKPKNLSYLFKILLIRILLDVELI